MNTFQETGLSNEILLALKDLGFEKPTSIQASAIPQLLTNQNDVIAIAQTGTGKTAAFSLPIIDKIDENSNDIQALILCPTRELCLQIKNDIESFTKYKKNIKEIAIYGGADFVKQLKELKNGGQIIVGTPGRVQDFINRKKLDLSNLKYLVLDEADEMLNRGFKEEIDEILVTIPNNVCTQLFSATMPKAIENIANKYMKNPLRISTNSESKGSDNVEHHYYLTQHRDRIEVLKRIVDSTPEIYGIVFCRTKIETSEVADQLIQNQYRAQAINGDLSQRQREEIMKNFRNQNIQLLIATDVAARGIDVEELTHVINYNIPESTESYVHRSGRTGRAHNKGISIAIISPRDERKIQFIEKKIGKKFTKHAIPTGEDICRKQLNHFVEKIIDGVNGTEKTLNNELKQLESKLENITKEDLLAYLLEQNHQNLKEKYQNSKDLNQFVKEKKGGDSFKKGKNNTTYSKNISFTKFEVNLGKSKQVGPKTLIQKIVKLKKLRNVEIGDIKIGHQNSTIEVDNKFKNEVLELLNQGHYKGTQFKAKIIK